MTLERGPDPMKILVPAQLAPRWIDAVRSAAPGAEVGALRVVRRRPIWAGAARFAARRWLPWEVARRLSPRLDEGRLRLQVDGAALRDGRGFDVLFAGWDLQGTALRHVVDALPDLRWIHSASTGVDRFDLEQLRRRGIQLTAVRGVHSRRIAEFVLAWVLSDAKGLDAFGGARPPPPVELSALTLGVVGFGSIGQEIARLALSNGLRVVAYVRSHARADAVPGVTTTTALPEVLGAADVLALALPLTETTRGLIGAGAFASLRRGALLVNVGRAGTVDEAALLRALGDGTVRRAVLDLVDDAGDVPPNHPLLRRPNVVYTGHRAGASSAAGDEVVDAFVAQLRRWHEGLPLEGAALEGAGGARGRATS